MLDFSVCTKKSSLLVVEISICTLLVCRNYYFYISDVDFMISTTKMKKNGNPLFGYSENKGGGGLASILPGPGIFRRNR